MLSACNPRPEQKTTDSQPTDSIIPAETAPESTNAIDYKVQDSIGPVFKLEDGERRPSYNVNIHLDLNDGITAEMQHELNRLFINKPQISLEEAVKFYADSIASSYREELVMLYSDTTVNIEFPYEFLYQAKGMSPSGTHPDVKAYKIDITTYAGGAHGGYYELWYNFDRKSGSHITAGEAFDMSREAELKEQIRQAICEKYECKDLQTLQDSLGILVMCDVFVNDTNFRLQKQGVEFLYNPYDIASWAVGLISVNIPYDRLNALCRFNNKP